MFATALYGLAGMGQAGAVSQGRGRTNPLDAQAYAYGWVDPRSAMAARVPKDPYWPRDGRINTYREELQIETDKRLKDVL